MGRYIEWDDVVNRYKKYGDIVTAEESQDSFIIYAENYLDSNLASHFTVPFSSNNLTAKDMCIDIAFAKTQFFKDTEKAEKIFDFIEKQIEKLKSGKMTMVAGDGVTVDQNGEPVYSQTMDYIPVFGKGDVIEFLVDSSQLYNEAIDRDY